MDGSGKQGNENPETEPEVLDAEVDVFEVPLASAPDHLRTRIGAADIVMGEVEEVPEDEDAPATPRIPDTLQPPDQTRMRASRPGAYPEKGTAIVSERPTGKKATRLVTERPDSETKARSSTVTRGRTPAHYHYILPAGSTIIRATRLFASSPLPFLLIALLASLPELLEHVGVNPWGEGIAGALLSGLASQTIANILLGVACYAVFEITLRGRVNLGAAFSTGLRRILPITVTSVLLTLIVYCGVFPACFLLLNPSLPRLFLAAPLVFVPMVILSCMLTATVPVCFVENRGPLASLRRSMELTKGLRGSIFLLFLTWGLLCLGIYIFSRFTIWVIITGFLGPDAGFIQRIVDAALGIWVLSITNVISGIIYHDILAVKEGVTTERLVRVFE